MLVNHLCIESNVHLPPGAFDSVEKTKLGFLSKTCAALASSRPWRKLQRCVWREDRAVLLRAESHESVERSRPALVKVFCDGT